MKASKEKQHPRQADYSASIQRSARRARTHRSATGRPVAATVWAAAIGTMCWLAASGETKAVMDAAPWLVLVSWFVYVAQWRPCLRVDDDGFTLVNGLRDHRIPFDTVEDIEVRYAVAVRAAGKKYVSWGAPTPPGSFESGFQHVSDLKSRPYSVLPSNERFSQPTVTTGRDEIAQAWQDARVAGLRSSDGTVTTTWNGPMIVVGVVVLLWVIVAALI
ncbi:PH domain-containing protein [Arthrobacter sp. ov407]|nr:PH domain-containing protein [Arthrobacter sp. ov407]